MLLVPYPSDADLWLDYNLSELSCEKRLERFPRFVSRVLLTPLLYAIVLDIGVLHHREGNTHNLLPCVWDLSCYRVDCSLELAVTPQRSEEVLRP